MAAAAEDVNADNEHTIEQRSTPSSPPSTPSKADEVLYCHFIPKKEFVEKGTPWIIHTSAKCYVCATVNFESMAMMRTAGPGGERSIFHLPHDMPILGSENGSHF